MKTALTSLEIGFITAELAPEMTVRINAYGNLALRHKSNPAVQFVIYRHADGLRLRRRIDTDSPFGVGHGMNNDKPFLSVHELVAYFKGYMAKYPKNLVTAFK